jgi:hypothetical protein
VLYVFASFYAVHPYHQGSRHYQMFHATNVETVSEWEAEAKAEESKEESKEEGKERKERKEEGKEEAIVILKGL